MGKRGNGEGSITKYKDGRWCGRYTIHMATGPKRKAVYGKTKAEVRVKLTKALADRDKGLIFNAENQTLEEYLNRWLEDSVRSNVAQRTFHNYGLQVRWHIVPELGRIKLGKLTPTHVQGLYRAKLDSGLSPSSVRYIHAVLHRALGQAVKWRLVPYNASKAVDLPKVSHREAQALSLEETKRFLAAARGDRLEALYVLALSTGLRQGELLGLQWKDIDFDAGKLGVNRQLQRMRDGSGLAFVPLKSPKATRTIELGSTEIEALKKHREQQSFEKTVIASSYGDQGLVFATAKGTPLDAQNIVNRSFKPLLDRAEVSRIKFHGLRHTCASLLGSKNVPIKVIQERLGHATSSITMDTYSHVLPGMQDKAARAMEEIFEGS